MTTPDLQKTLDELRDLAKSAQQVVGDVRKSHEALDGRVAKISDELKAGAIDATTKAAYQDAVEKVAKHESSLDKLNAEVAELRFRLERISQLARIRCCSCHCASLFRLERISQLARMQQAARVWRAQFRLERISQLARIPHTSS